MGSSTPFWKARTLFSSCFLPLKGGYPGIIHFCGKCEVQGYVLLICWDIYWFQQKRNFKTKENCILTTLIWSERIWIMPKDVPKRIILVNFWQKKLCHDQWHGLSQRRCNNLSSCREQYAIAHLVTHNCLMKNNSKKHRGKAGGFSHAQLKWRKMLYTILY